MLEERAFLPPLIYPPRQGTIALAKHGHQESLNRLLEESNMSTPMPITAAISPAGHLLIGGCDLADLAQQFGTPLYVFDEATLRSQCRGYTETLAAAYPDSLAIYACKAFINSALARILDQEGMGLDVVSGGELFVAHKSGFPMHKVYFHGNNKSSQELAMALDLGVGRIVVDNLHEMALLNHLAVLKAKRVPVLLRLSPGVDAHTHAAISTGIVDSKFGFLIATGQAEAALAQALTSPGLEVVGIHAHIGSMIFELEPYRLTIDALLDFAAEVWHRHGLAPREFSPGGGWGIAYTAEDQPPSQSDVVRMIAAWVKEGAAQRGLPSPRLILEPGRSIVGPAGVALYTVGSSKDIPGVRKYVAVDGGMSDNIRPAIYGSRYEAVVANRMNDLPEETVTIAGKYCESGDVLIRDIALPRLAPGDLLALPAAGAYCLSMASNYNLALRAAVVLVRDGQARLIRRRETYEDLLRFDL
jgi:diaminopimelate decarboxylase